MKQLANVISYEIKTDNGWERVHATTSHEAKQFHCDEDTLEYYKKYLGVIEDEPRLFTI